MNYKYLVAILSLFSAAPILPAAEPVLALPAIAGKPPGAVAKLLGQPSSQEKTKYGPKNSYQGGKIEVVFIEGKADWITVSDMGKVPFDAKAIESLGLKLGAPDFRGPAVIRWDAQGGYNSVSVFPLKNGMVDYVYLKVATK
jgi:hypothetical protein